MNRLPENYRTKPWFDGIGKHQVNCAAKKLLKECLEIHVLAKPTATHSNQHQEAIAQPRLLKRHEDKRPSNS